MRSKLNFPVYVFIMKAESKLYLLKGGGYTPLLSEARIWKTKKGAVRFFQNVLVHWNSQAILIAIE